MNDITSLKAEIELLNKSLEAKSEKLKKSDKKLKKYELRSERGIETMFRLLSKNHYTLNTMIDRKSNILISINAIILSIIISVGLTQMSRDPHLLYAILIILITNLGSITYAVLATRPELNHGNDEKQNLLYYGNFTNLKEEEYLAGVSNLMNQGDELYNAISRDTFYLGKELERKFKLLRSSFNVFLVGIILSVFAFLLCHLLFEGMI